MSIIYQNVEAARFVKRVNRFTALVETENGIETCHVKNTGRLRELFVPGADVFVQRVAKAERKTALDLITVQKGERLVNVDSQVPNKVAAEWVRNSGLFSEKLLVRGEQTFGNSRFDLYLEDREQKGYMEVKGVTLENDGVCRFPDAPTERGVKHVLELIRAKEEGYMAFILFVIQMEKVKCLMPNMETHPEFGQALQKAALAGVKILAIDSIIEADRITAGKEIPVILSKM